MRCSPNPDTRVAFLTMAQSWMHLADSVEARANRAGVASGLAADNGRLVATESPAAGRPIQNI